MSYYSQKKRHTKLTHISVSRALETHIPIYARTCMAWDEWMMPGLCMVVVSPGAVQPSRFRDRHPACRLQLAWRTRSLLPPFSVGFGRQDSLIFIPLPACESEAVKEKPCASTTSGAGAAATCYRFRVACTTNGCTCRWQQYSV